MSVSSAELAGHNHEGGIQNLWAETTNKPPMSVIQLRVFTIPMNTGLGRYLGR
jgi:hypothetical protein